MSHINNFLDLIDEKTNVMPFKQSFDRTIYLLLLLKKKVGDKKKYLENENEIIVNVNNNFRKPFKMKINLECTVDQILATIASEYKMDMNSLFFIYNDCLEKFNTPIKKLSIKNGYNIYIHKFETKDSNIKIFIQTVSNKIISLNIGIENTIEELKILINEKENMPMHEQRLIYAGKQLENFYKLKDYNIQNNSTLYLVLRLRGGMFHKTSGTSDYDKLLHVVHDSSTMDKFGDEIKYMGYDEICKLNDVLDNKLSKILK